MFVYFSVANTIQFKVDSYGNPVKTICCLCSMVKYFYGAPCTCLCTYMPLSIYHSFGHVAFWSISAETGWLSWLSSSTFLHPRLSRFVFVSVFATCLHTHHRSILIFIMPLLTRLVFNPVNRDGSNFGCIRHTGIHRSRKTVFLDQKYTGQEIQIQFDLGCISSLTLCLT